MEMKTMMNKNVNIYKWIAIAFLAIEVLFLAICIYIFSEVITEANAKNFKTSSDYEFLIFFGVAVIYTVLFIILTYLFIRRNLSAGVKHSLIKLILIFIFMIVPAFGTAYFLYLLESIC